MTSLGLWLCLSATVGVYSSDELVVPLSWIQPEGRLTFNVSVEVQGTWYTSMSRVDLGSKIGLMLPTSSCTTTGCSSCVNDQCACAPSQSLLMPADKCPDGNPPSGSLPAKNGRTYAECTKTDVNVRLGGSNARELTLKGNTLTDVLYMTKVANCQAGSAAKTGFNGGAPFTHAVYEQLGSSVFRFSVGKQEAVFGASLPGSPAATVPTQSKGSGGRQVKIIAVNGVAGDATAAIDSGNGAFLSYGPGSPLSAAKHFPFNLTFEGGDTLVFESAPLVNGVATAASQYSHNVLSLGFMADYDVTFDDAKDVAYFSSSGGSTSAIVV